MYEMIGSYSAKPMLMIGTLPQSLFRGSCVPGCLRLFWVYLRVQIVAGLEGRQPPRVAEQRAKRASTRPDEVTPLGVAEEARRRMVIVVYQD